MVAALLEQVEEAGNVAVNVGSGIDEAVTYSCLGGEVDNYVELVVGEQAFQSGFVAQVKLAETVWQSGRDVFFSIFVRSDAALCQACFFESDIVIIIERVNACDLMALLCEPECEMVADESGVSSNEDLHDGCFYRFCH